jgi:dTMP kinase
VYQGAGRGIDRATILDLHRIACGGVCPNLTLLLDIDLETSLHRARQRNHAMASNQTRMDDQDRAFFERVRAGYHDLALAEPDRVRVIDARGSIESVADRVWEEVRKHV